MKDVFWRQTWSELSQKLESLLADNWNPEDQASTTRTLQDQFELQVNFHGVESLSLRLPDNHIERVVAVFKRLHLYFQYGLLLENRDQKFSPVAFFEEGRVQVASGPFHDMKISLPITQHLQVMRTPGALFTKKLQLNWDPQSKCQAYLIRPTQDFAFILLSPVPDLWMQDQMALLAKELHKIFIP